MSDRLEGSALNVIICLPYLADGGISRIALLLASGLVERGHNVSVVLHESGAGPSLPIPQGLRVVYHSDGPYRRWRLPSLSVFTLAHVLGADVVIAASEGRAGILSLLAGALVRRPVIGWIHFDWREFGRLVSGRTRIGLELYRSAARVVAVSQGALDGISEVAGLDQNLALVIPNGVPVEEVARRAVEPLPMEFEQAFSGPSIVAVGRLETQKGFDILIRALALLRAQGRSECIVLVGRGGEQANLAALAQELGIADAVHFAGFQANPFAFMARATVVAMPSRFEGMPMALIEALAVGAAVVASDCRSGPREVLDSGRYGLLVPVEDPKALAAALTTLLEDESLRARLRAAAPVRAAEYDDEGFIARWEALVHEVSASQR